MEHPGLLAAPDPSDDAGGGIRITALSIDDAARMVRAAGGGDGAEDVIRRNIAAGAPVNEDGTLNLVHYAAWLAHRVLHGA